MKRILAHPVAWPATVLAALLVALVITIRARAEISGPVDPGVESRVEEMQGLPIPPVDAVAPAPRVRAELPADSVEPSPAPEREAITAGGAPSGEARDLESTYGADIARLKQWYSSACPVRAVSQAATVTSYTLEETLDRRIAAIGARIRAIGGFLVDPEGLGVARRPGRSDAQTHFSGAPAGPRRGDRARPAGAPPRARAHGRAGIPARLGRVRPGSGRPRIADRVQPAQ